MTAAAPTSAVESSALPQKRRGLLSLVRFYDACSRSRLGAQLGKLLAVLITLAHAIALPFAARAASGDASDAVVVSALCWLTWLAAGAVALSAVGRGSDEAPARELALTRGFSPSRINVAELLASARRVLFVVGVPALLLALSALALSRSLHVVQARALLLLGVVGYVVVLCALVAALVRVSRSLGPQSPRSVLLGLVVLPHFLHELFARVPSIPSLVGFLTRELLSIGASFR